MPRLAQGIGGGDVPREVEKHFLAHRLGAVEVAYYGHVELRFFGRTDLEILKINFIFLTFLINFKRVQRVASYLCICKRFPLRFKNVSVTWSVILS